MDVILAGTGETVDLPIIVFGIALLFGLLFLALWFPGWIRQRLREAREEEFIESLEEGYAGRDSTIIDDESAAPPR